jgi:hypothetical protein
MKHFWLRSQLSLNGAVSSAVLQHPYARERGCDLDGAACDGLGFTQPAKVVTLDHASRLEHVNVRVCITFLGPFIHDER